MYTSQQASYKALPNSTRSRRVSGNHSSSRPSLQQAVYRPSPATSNGIPVAPPTPLASSNKTNTAPTAAAAAVGGASGAGIGITLQSWALSQYQVVQQQSTPQKMTQQKQPQRPNSAVFQTPSYQYLAQTPNGHTATPTPTPRQQQQLSSLSNGSTTTSGDGKGMMQFAVADYFDPYRSSHHRGQTVDVDAAEAGARANSSPPVRKQGKDHRATAAPPSPVMRATRHSRPSTPTSPVSPTGATLRSQQQHQQQHQHQLGAQLSPSAQSSIDSLRSVANVTPVANRTTQQQQQQQSSLFISPQASRNLRASASATTPNGLSQSPGALDPHAISARMKPRSHTSTEGVEPEMESRSMLDVRPIRPPPLPYTSRPRVSSMYDTGTASVPVFGESRARKAESPTKLDLGSSVTKNSNSGAGDQAVMQRPIARPKNLKAQQSQPIQKRDRIVGPAAADTPQPSSHGSTEMKKSNLIEFIEQQRQQHQAKMTAAQKTQTPRGPVIPATTSRPEAPAKLTSRSDSTGSMQSDSSERSFKRSTARLVEVESATARKQPTANAGTAEPSEGKAPDPAPRAKFTSWYGNNMQPRLEPTTTAAEPVGIDLTQDPAMGLPVSTRMLPRVRAYSHTSPEPSDVPGIGGIRARNSNDSLGSCSYARAPRTTATPEPLPPKSGRRGAAAPNPYSRNPRHLSVAVQTDDIAAHSKPKGPDMVSRGMQTSNMSSGVIHGDDAVLDLMRQMDVQRSTHAVQITEYQEQVIDLELFNQDLATEIDQLTERLTTREKEHTHAVHELRTRLDVASSRADREIGEVKGMHAAKCNELTAQVSMLLARCQRYRQKLVDVGVSEDELLQLGTQRLDNSGNALHATPASDSEQQQLQIADLAFIEKQYIETRESSQEADYFKQLMDIERSMENTTMALGFELKRTQAKYLQQAADFIREQMAKLQVETTRSESRLTRALSLRAPAKIGASLVTDMLQEQQRPPVPPLSFVAAPGSDAPDNNASLAQTVAGHTHRRIAGPDPSSNNAEAISTAELEAASEQAALLHQSRQTSSPVSTATGAEVASHPPQLPAMARQRSSSMTAYPDHNQTMQPRWATVSNALGIRRNQRAGSLAIDGSGGAVARGFQSESRTSGLSRMINASTSRQSSRLAEQQKPGAMALGSDIEGTSELGAYLSSHSSNSSAGFSSSSSSPPRRVAPHRSPLSNIASGFFTASIDSMVTSTTVGGNEALGLLEESHDVQLLNTSNGTLVAATPKHRAAPVDFQPSSSSGTRPISMVIGKSGGSSSLGYFSGHRKMHETSPALSSHSSGGGRLKSHGSSGDDVLGSSFGSFKSLNWPRSSERKTSRSNSVIDSQDMTAEELLESLKLPMPSGSLGTSSRPGSSYGSSPSPGGGGSLGRHSPLPRTNSFTDGSRTLPSSASRFSSAVFSESPASDSTLLPTSFATTTTGSFDPKAEVNINLGLDNSSSQGSTTSSRRGANNLRSTGSGSSRRMGNRRRSRSICVWERR